MIEFVAFVATWVLIWFSKELVLVGVKARTGLEVLLVLVMVFGVLLGAWLCFGLWWI